MRKVAVLFAVFTILCAIMPCAAGNDDSMRVLISVDREEYHSGDDIKITVHVFDKGEYVSADNLSVSVGYYPQNTTVEMTETRTGIYKGNYTVSEDDFAVHIIAWAKGGTDRDDTVTTLYIKDETQEETVDFTVNIELDQPGNYYAKPGDDVEIIVTVRENKTLVDADSLEVSVDGENLQHTRTGTGTYKVTKSIPSTLKEGKEYQIMANAQKGELEDTDWEYFYVVFFLVGYHNVTKTDTSSTFDIYISDLEGKVVSGATVEIAFDDDDDGQTPEITETGTTDSQGKVTFSITYSKQNYVEIQGAVSHEGYSQEFDGDIHVSSEIEYEREEVDDEGFDVVFTGKYEYYEQGDTARREYTAYYDGEIMVSWPIHFYVTDHHPFATEVVTYGTADTDENGRFITAFLVPEKAVQLHFEAGTPKTPKDSSYDEDDDMVYHSDSDQFYTVRSADIESDWGWDTDNVSISMEPLVLGEKNTVTVRAINVPEDAQFVALWLLGNVDDVDDISSSLSLMQDWEIWAGEYGTYLAPSNGQYTGELVIPEFMPANEKYTIIAGWITADEGSPHINYLVLKPGEGGETPAPIADDMGTVDPEGEKTEIAVGTGTEFTQDGEVSSVVLKDVTDNGATLEIDSTSEELTLSVGETREVDTDGDGRNDMAITLDSVDTGEQTAELTFRPIAGEEDGGDSAMTLLIVLAAVVVIIIVALVIAGRNKGKKDKGPTEWKDVEKMQ